MLEFAESTLSFRILSQSGQEYIGIGRRFQGLACRSWASWWRQLAAATRGATATDARASRTTGSMQGSWTAVAPV